MNDAGLAVSLTFGGSQQVGDGFGIPLIMRYILETCTTVAQTIAVLQRIPSHMAYNVTVIDAQGDFATVMVGVEGNIHVTRERAITNHQQRVVWSQQAQFSKTIERKHFLDELLQTDCTPTSLTAAFLQAPLRSTQYDQNFGTVYTAVYQPQSGRMRYVWTDQEWSHSFDDFKDAEISVHLLPAHTNANDFVTANTHAYDMTGAMREVLHNMLQYIDPAVLPNPQAATQLSEALQVLQYEWIQFANDFASIWTMPSAQQAMVNVDLDESMPFVQHVDAVSAAPTTMPSMHHSKPKRFAIAFH